MFINPCYLNKVMFVNNINPMFLSIFGLEIRYYGIIYALSFLIGYYFIKKINEKRNLKLDVDSLITYLIIGTVLGARIFEVLFYNPGFFIKNPLEIVMLWHGGLSFHGGLIGAMIAAYIFCRKNKVDYLELADIVSIPLALGLFLGRIANFINGELYGYETTLPWAVKFQGVEGFRHPTQIYESIKNLLIFFVLFNLKDKELKKGTIFFVFITLYGLFRFFIEFLKVPESYLLGLPTGQLFSLAMFLTGICLLYRNHKV